MCGIGRQMLLRTKLLPDYRQQKVDGRDTLLPIDNKELFLFVIDAIHQQLSNCQVIIHSPKCAFSIINSSIDRNAGEKVCIVPNAYTSQASFTVAAGDAFNGGICLGLLVGCAPEEMLIIGNAVASYFIRTGQRCNQSQVIRFLDQYIQYLEEDHSEMLEF